MIRRKKLKKRILDALNPQKELSTDRGKFITSQFTKPNKKVRRHSGRVYPKIFGPQRVLDEEGIFVDYYWDNWVDYRDNFRDCRDRTKLRKRKGHYWIDKEEIIKWNNKLKRQIAIRKSKGL